MHTPVARLNILSIILCLLIASCSGTRHLPAGEKLYTGATVKLQSTGKIKNKRALLTTVEKAVAPRPNKKFLGMRPKLWLYNVAGNTTKEKGFRAWLKKQGESPVLLSNVKPGETATIIDAKLFNKGVFKSITEFKIKEKKYSAKVEYISYVHTPYKINHVIFPTDNDSLSNIIRNAGKNSLIKTGDDYHLDVLRAERERIDAVLKDSGYFFFNADYLIFYADSSDADQTIELVLKVKKESPLKATHVYRIGNIIVDTDYSLQEDTGFKKDTLSIDEMLFIYKEKRVRPRVIANSIFFRRNDIYSRKNHNMTLNRLMTIGNYKFVNVKFTESDTSLPGYLNTLVLLTPLPKRTFRSEIDLVSKSNDFAGPKVSLNYRNRNTFNGAELFNLSLGGSFETQISGSNKGLYSFEINPKAELFVPGFILPFKIKTTRNFYQPKTKFLLGYDYLQRISYFNLRSFQFQYGYKWKINIKKEHELLPVNINLTTLAKESPAFILLLEQNPFLKKSYEEQFIIGSSYAFTYNEQVIPEKPNQFYFNTTAEVSGNSISLVKTLQGQKVSPANPGTIAGAVYSQFVRVTIDLRDYINFKNKNKIALRFYTGLGKAYGNSSTLPYIKQFFSGGPNSIRAFKINSLGPGTYLQSSNNKLGFLDLGGDVKLEINAEYRCNLVNMIKGAVFIDAGNVWLLKSNIAVNSQPFAFNRFYKELAVGTGVGLRVDASFFVLRFDLGIPLRKPWLQENKSWAINPINFNKAAWRSDNLILNIAIGYPF